MMSEYWDQLYASRQMDDDRRDKIINIASRQNGDDRRDNQLCIKTNGWWSNRYPTVHQDKVNKMKKMLITEIFNCASRQVKKMKCKDSVATSLSRPNSFARTVQIQTKLFAIYYELIVHPCLCAIMRFRRSHVSARNQNQSNHSNPKHCNHWTKFK